jgi:hypothetical protein
MGEEAELEIMTAYGLGEDMEDRNPRAVVGGNNPPADPFGAIKAHISDLYEEAKGFLDGEPIATEGQADAVASLLDQIRQAEKTADEIRKEENRPFDEGKAAVQAKFAPLIADTKSVRGLTVLAAEACKAALAPWRQEQERIKREAADRARREAEEAAAKAAEAARVARDDLAAQEQAEAAIRAADAAAKVANKAEKSATTGTGLRSYWAPKLVNGVEAARHYWQTDRAACEEFFLSLANRDTRAGHRTIPGFEVIEERRAV